MGCGRGPAWLHTCLVLGGMLLWLVGCEQADFKSVDAEVPPEGPRVGFRAPDFVAPTLNGEGLPLSGYHGKVIMINFWATWCIPCRVEMPSMEHLYTKYGGEDFEILAVNGGERKDIVQPFINDLKINFPVLLDEQFEVHQKYQVTALPYTFLVNQKGVITHRFFGAVEWDDAENQEVVAKLIQSE